MFRMTNRVSLNSVFLCLTLALGACGSETAPPAQTGTGGKGGTGGAGSGGTSGSGGTAGSGGSGGGSGGQSGSGGGSGGQSGSGGGSGGATDGGMDVRPEVAAPMDTAPEVPVGTGPMVLTSTAFAMNAMIPQLHKCMSSPPGGMNVSPPFSWTPGPAGTMSYAITLNHVASGAPHWAIWNIPASVTSLAGAIPNEEMPGAPAPPGTKQSRLVNFDQFSGFGYLGPCPQNPGMGQYRFSVWAINVANLPVPAPSGGGNSHAGVAINTIMGARVAGPMANSKADLVGTQVRN